MPENALLSHDLFEGLHARTALVTDVEVVDDYPGERPRPRAAPAPLGARRLADPAAGSCPWVPDARAASRATACRSISRFKIFDNLRRSLVAPGHPRRCCSRPGRVLPGSAAALDRWPSLAVAGASRSIRCCCDALRGPRPQQPLARLPARRWRGPARRRSRAGVAAAHASSPTTPGRCCTRSSLTLVRLVVTQRRLLEWETAAAAPRAPPGSAARAALRVVPGRDGGEPARSRSLAARWSSALRPGALAAAAARSSLLWAAAPARRLRAQPARAPRAGVELDDEDRAVPARVGAQDLGLLRDASSAPRTTGCRPTTSRRSPGPRVAHRTSPTNIGMGLLSTLAAHDLGFIDTRRAGRAPRAHARRRSRASSGYEGHLLNWYDTRSLAPLLPALRLDRRQRQPGRRADGAGAGLRQLARDGRGARRRAARARRRAAAFARRHGLPLPLRPAAPASSPSATGWPTPRARAASTPRIYDLLASEARLASFIAIAKGDVPQAHWFHLGRLVTSVDGAPTLLSWSATMFEYLMPLLFMRSYPGDAARPDLPHGGAAADRATRRDRGVPWGISESAYNRRRPPRQLPVQGLRRARAGPEARPRRRAGGRALRHRARRARRPGGGRREPAAPGRARGSTGAYGFYEAIDYTPRQDRRALAVARPSRRAAGAVVRAYLAHHQGMTLVALANVLHGDPMVGRFHADPRVQATELLLQERVPRAGADHRSRGRPRRRASPAPAPALATRRFRSPHTALPARAVPLQRRLHRGGHQRRRRRQLLPRPRGHAPPRGRDPRPGQPVPLPARRAQRRRLVGHLPAHAAASPTTTWSPSCPRRRPSAARDDEHRDPARDRGLARGRRRGAPPRAHQPQRPRRARSRSRATPRSCSAPPADDLAHPGLRQAVRRDRVPARERRPRLPPPAARAPTSRRLGASTC